MPNQGRPAREVVAIRRRATKFEAAGTWATDMRRNRNGAGPEADGPVSRMPNGTDSSGPAGATIRASASATVAATVPMVAAYSACAAPVS